MKNKSSKLSCTDKERSNSSGFRFSGCSNRSFVLAYPHIMFTDPMKVEEKCKDSYDEQNVWPTNEGKRKKPKLVLDMTFSVQDASSDRYSDVSKAK